MTDGVLPTMRRSPLTPWAISLTRGWVRLYSAGLPREVRVARRDEIDSDLWEHLALASQSDPSGSRTSWEILGRCLRGMPADLFWRLNVEGEPKMVSKTIIERFAGLALLLLVVLMVGTAASGFGIGSEVQYFQDDFPALARDRAGFGLGLALGTIMSIVIILTARVGVAPHRSCRQDFRLIVLSSYH